MSRKTLGMISGKVKVVDIADLDPNRYDFLSLENAEPNPGAPSSDNGLLSSGADGSRAWLIPNQGLSVSLSNDLFVDETGVPIDTSVYNYSSSNILSDVLVDLDQAITNAVAGSLDSVATDSTINGDGTTNNPLSVALGGDAETLGGELPSYYLNYNNFTNTPTIGDGTITISAGTGLSGTSAFTTNQSSNETITLDNTDKGSNQNIFKNVAVSGQNTLVADSNNDTLNIVGGSSINITTDAATDTLTIDFDGTEANSYVDSVSFDNTTGDLTLTRNGSLTDLTASLDGRYLLEGAKAADADLLDGEDGTYYLNYNNFTNTPTLYTSSDFDVDFSNKSTSDLSEGTNLYYTDTRVRSAVSASGDLSYDSVTGVFSYTERTDQQIRNLFSASGDLNYDSSTGEFSVTIPPGYNSSDFDTDFSSKSTDDLSEGSTNLYYTDSRARTAVSASGDLSYNSSTGVFSFTERTDSEVRNLFSSSGDLSYNASTGEFSVTTYKSSDFDTDFSGKSTSDLSEGTNLYYTDARVDSHLSGGTGVSYSSGTISIGQPVGITDNVEFNDVVVGGNLTVSGTTTTVNTETLDIADNNITLNSNYDGSSPTENGGITINRGTVSDVVLQWNESSDHWEIESGGTTGRILTTGDEGSGNGLDADLLDGQDGTHYLNYNNFSNTPTIGSGTLTVSGGSGLSGSGTFDANATTNSTITINHADTSTQGNISTTDGTIIHSISLDTYGHITTMGTRNLDSRYLTSETSTLDTVTDRGNTTTNTIGVGGVSIDSSYDLNSSTGSTSSTTQTSVASFSSSAHGSAKLVVQVSDSVSGEKQISELLVAHDGTNAFGTEYGVVYTGAAPLAEFDVDISSGNVRLLATAASSNSTSYTISETLMV